MMAGKRTSSSSSSSKSTTTSSVIDDKTLLKFYQRKFEEHQRNEDRYKEKIDKHLKNLVTDRHELEEEVLKRGEKISDLQKALVELQLSVFEERERFLKVSAENEELKRNEEQLHANIRQLLAMTHQQDLRDKIIYILKDPKVQVGYRTDYAAKSRSTVHENPANKKLQEELEYLQNQLDEVLKVSRSKADVVLEDCRQALEKSKEKILQDEILIRELQNRLSNLNVQKIVSPRSWPSVIEPLNLQKDSSSRILPSATESLNIQKSSSSRFAPAATESINVQKSSSSRFAPAASESINVQKSSSSRFAPPASESINVQKSSSSRFASASTESVNVQKSSSSRVSPADSESLNVQRSSSSRFVPSSESLNVQKSSSSRFLPSSSESLTIQKRSSSRILPTASEARNVHKSSSSRILPDDSESLNAHKSSSHRNLATSSQLLKTTSSDSFVNVCSNLKDIHLSLILLLKIITKVTNILNSIQATKLYQRVANIPKPPYDMQPIVEEKSILQLETFLRQSTRLTFDINNMLKSVIKYISSNKKNMQNINELRSELNHLNDMLQDMTALTAENDLINVGLKRSSFFYALRDSSVNIQGSERRQNIDDFKKIVSNCETLYDIVSEASDFVESVIEKYNAKKSFEDSPADYFPSSTSELLEPQEERSRFRKSAKSDSELISVKKVKSYSYKSLENLLRIYKRTVEEAENRGLGHTVETKLISEKLKELEKEIEKEEEAIQEESANAFNERKPSNSRTGIRVSESEEMIRKSKEAENTTEKEERMKESSDDFVKNKENSEFQTLLRASNCEAILRKIDKVLSKVKRIERGEYLKDEELCKKLGENVNDLTKKFKELTEDFNVKSFQEQFSEYSRVTLGKLEELAKQSKNSVIAAEAQIAAHRSNAKNLSNKLKETEDLLRESINECLSLKQRLKQVEDKHEMDKYTLYSGLKEKLSKATSVDVVDKVMDELDVYITASKGTQADPYVCMYCQQGKGHKLCQEQIENLRKEEQKSRVQLKMLMQEAKNEKETFIHYRNIAEKAAADLSSTNEALKEEVKKMESKNGSLLEQLKLEKNRTKNMERFRRLEIEGFQTDIKNLKTKIKDLEKQLLKAVLIFENNNKDLDLLKSVHETALHSKQATVALRRLKAKLYELENDIKSL